MTEGISRRLFLVLTGSAFASPSILLSEEQVPSLLDHILLGCSDLDRGIAFVEEHTGVRAAFGGVHPGRGTRNALLSLGERRYLEIIAPDPNQPDATDPLALHLRKLAEPQIVGWAAHPGDIQSLAKKLSQSGIATEGPTPGSRKRPGGRMLQWKTLTLKENAFWLLPFFIEWSTDSLHPAADSPKGCSLVRFEATTPDPQSLKEMASALGLDLPIAGGEKAQLRATIAGPRGQFFITS